MKNSLMDLNNHLFAALERLNDEGIDDEKLAQEIGRAKAIGDVASKIIDNATVALNAEKLKAEYGRANFSAPKMIGKQDG